MVDARRRLVSDLLGRIYVPLTRDDILMCLRAGGDSSVGEAYLDGVLDCEYSDYRNGLYRQAWICPALELETGRACDEFITRSDWVMQSRFVSDVLTEAQELLLLQRLCDLAISIQERGVESFDRNELHERIDDLTVHFSSEQVSSRLESAGPGKALYAYRELAEDLYARALRPEKPRFAAAAQRLSTIEELGRYFGVDRGME